MAGILLSAAPENKIATVSGKKKITYKEFRERIYRLANGLYNLGEERRRISIMLYNTNEFVESMLVTLTTGGVTIPINWHLRGGELEYVITNSDTNTLIFDEEFLNTIVSIKSGLKNVDNFVVVGDEAPSDMILYEDLLESASSEKPKPIPDTGFDILMYTAGTTGKPKGAGWGVIFESLLRPGAPRGRSGNAKYALGMMRTITTGFDYHKTTNIHLAAGPLYHAAPYLFALITYIVSGTIVAMRKFRASKALELIEKEKISTTFMAPTLLKRIIEFPDKDEYDVSSMKSLIVAAAPCPVDLKKNAVEFFGPVLYEFYGSSDAAINTILRPEHYLKDPMKYASVGKVAPGNEIRIIDEDGNACPPGKAGDFYVMNALTRGLEYYNDPEKTKSALREIDGEMYFDEGEIMYKDDEGFYFVVDRKKDLIISGGVNIYPAEIEQVLYNHPKIFDAAIIGVPDPEWSESVKAVVQLREGESASEEGIISYCKERLAGYKKPKSVEFIDELPRHPDGKIMKRKLREKYVR
jgi:acyl-CoA synthetase (AMP-forming)/AMP-acid ligase II